MSALILIALAVLVYYWYSNRDASAIQSGAQQVKIKYETDDGEEMLINLGEHDDPEYINAVRQYQQFFVSQYGDVILQQSEEHGWSKRNLKRKLKQTADFYFKNMMRLDKAKRKGWKVEIIQADDPCDVCDGLQRKYDPENAPHLPHINCNKMKHHDRLTCRCLIQPVAPVQ